MTKGYGSKVMDTKLILAIISILNYLFSFYPFWWLFYLHGFQIDFFILYIDPKFNPFIYFFCVVFFLYKIYYTKLKKINFFLSLQRKSCKK